MDQKIGEAAKEKIRNMPLFGTENFRSWMLYFEPGDGTPMHYHQSPETFLVIDGKCSVKSIDGAERIIEKNQIIFLAAKDTIHLPIFGTDRWFSSANRSNPSVFLPLEPGKRKPPQK